ncbi:MAG: 4-hydroxythreonine-4-phosphate dehydrogenase PdxA [Spirochaetes bacterium GWB1_36_13]|nr:MAG: 4-hydroxythreonine-4-phosphate dehydrogenase PdxA [Spirochaetes bacterium GWB1_36_13]
MDPLIITVGDPGGIGYEIILKTLSFLKKQERKLVLIGNENAFHFYASKMNEKADFGKIELLSVGKKSFVPAVGKDDPANGEIALASLNLAIEMIRRKESNTLLTGPISKKSIVMAGEKDFKGHTGYLAAAFQVKNETMMLANKDFAVALATTHIPLKEVSKELSVDSLIHSAVHLCQFAEKREKKYEVLVCGLNPHAGESGEMGDEEEKVIIPAINHLKAMGYPVSGPYPSDSLFKKAYLKTGKYFLGMYHDQGLIPVKMLGQNQTVNITLGLPFFRISVEHGTAYEIAGKNLADPKSFLTAFEWLEN